ncbi:hypothetical protein PCYB_003250, partial [Plasmodium cynomolgi strain B]
RLLESPSSDLLSGKFYNALNQNVQGLRKYFKDCESLNSVPNGNFLKIYCAQLVKYIKTKYENSHEQNNEYDDCSLLNYWIFGKLSRVIPNNSSISSNNICDPIFEIYKQDDWYERKEFYDYCVDYKTLLDTANSYDSSCEVYYKYIESKIPIYEHIKKLCTSENAEKCPNFYAQFKDYDPKLLLSNLKCHKTMLEKEPALENVMATQAIVTSLK